MTLFAIDLLELRDALERENTVREVANCNISTASELIIRSGVDLCPERWLFWKSRLSKVTTDEVDEEVAMMAQQAVSEMERVENVVRNFRAMDVSTGEIDQ